MPTPRSIVCVMRKGFFEDTFQGIIFGPFCQSYIWLACVWEKEGKTEVDEDECQPCVMCAVALMLRRLDQARLGRQNILSLPRCAKSCASSD
jgi:hypothetical protein